jgi:hypothetical protein
VAATPAPASVAPAPAAIADDPAVTAPTYPQMLKVLRQEEQRALAVRELQPTQLPSLFDDGVFETRQLLPANSQRVFRGKQAPKEAQFTAFEFQR